MLYALHRVTFVTLVVSLVWRTASGARHVDIDRLRQQYRWPSGSEAVGSDPPLEQECAVSELAYQYALELQPEQAPLLDLFDALQLHTKCHLPRPAPARDPAPPSFPIPPHALYVDPSEGSDEGLGTETEPLRTVHAALARVPPLESRQVADNPGDSLPGRTIVLRRGIHYLNATLTLGPAHSHLTITNYPGEEAWLSGGRVIEPAWVPGWGATAPPPGAPLQGGAPPLNVYHTHLPDLPRMLGLNRLNCSDLLHARMVRARHPNRDVAAGSMERGLMTGGHWLKPPGWGYPGFNVSTTVYMDQPSSDQAANGCGEHFTYGVGGEMCARYTPPGGYWCSNHSSGGGSGWELMVPGAPLFPVGLEVDAHRLFTSQGVPSPASWRNKSGAVIETWTNGWSTTFWEVRDIVNTTAGNATFVFERGGQQTGRGFHIDPVPPSPVHGPSGPINTEGGWKVENALELLDAPEEFFFDEATRVLTLAFNGTGPPPARGWVVPHLKTLLRIQGTQADPVRGVRVQGVGFRDAEYTYLDEWGMPSGGDWALHRGGAVVAEGAAGLAVHRCAFTLLDGNALFLSGYTRNATISNSSFAYLGDNAMAAWGYTADVARPGSEVALPAGVGIDGTAGEQPRFTSILGNIVREIGMNERQSSAWSEAVACQSHVAGNLFFNMPRAAINKNDGFGGGTVVERNLLVNTCRESGDHGPFNSWDRLPFLSDVRTGAPSLIPANNTIRHNFLVSNYGAGFGVDNDDTSSYYLIHHNFFYLGGGVKCDYDGHEKRFYNNLMLGTTAGCWHTCAYKKGFPDYCHNNTFVQATRAMQPATPPFAIIWFCDAKNVSHILPDYNNEVQMGEFIHHNTVLNAEGKATVTCGYSGNASETTVPLSAFTDAGLMQGTVAGKAPKDEVVLGWARELLGMEVASESHLPWTLRTDESGGGVDGTLIRWA